MDGLTVGSLCSGFGGLDLGLQRAGFTIAWHVENDAACSTVLDHHWPGVPNHSDLKACDWSAVEPVDVVAGGYPCQPFSHAGRRLGEDDPRHLWPFVCAAVRHLRPGLVLLENVAGHRSLGFGRVLGDLAEVGYDATWASVRASDVGAPHGRERVFILAAPADAHGRDVGQHTGVLLGAQEQGRWDQDESNRPCGSSEAPADADGGGRREPGLLGGLGSAGRVAEAPADPHDEGPQGRQPAAGRLLPAGSGAAPADGDLRRRQVGRDGRQQRQLRDDADRRGTALADADDRRREQRHSGQRVVSVPQQDSAGDRPVDWLEYEPAIRRWEHAFGEPAPDPLDDRGRLNVDLTRWMMGFPPGWHGTAGRTAALRGYGNAVQVQVAQLVGRWAREAMS